MSRLVVIGSLLVDEIYTPVEPPNANTPLFMQTYNTETPKLIFNSKLKNLNFFLEKKFPVRGFLEYCDTFLCKQQLIIFL